MLCYIWQADQQLSPSDSLPICQQASLDLALQIKATASVSQDVLPFRANVFFSSVLTAGRATNDVARLFRHSSLSLSSYC